VRRPLSNVYVQFALTIADATQPQAGRMAGDACSWDYSYIARPAMWRNLRRLIGVTIDLDCWPMKTVPRVISALALSFVVGVTLASANGQDGLTALRSSVSFASITAALVALLSFGMEKAQDKGYPRWIGLLLVVFLNVLGLVILTLLPDDRRDRVHSS
jgi:hypothetical protein